MQVMRPAAETIPTQAKWTLPPLILHPFTSDDSADRLMEGSKASLILNGLLPGGGKEREALEDAVLRSRLLEVRMLYFLGRDLIRWAEQSVEFVDRRPELRSRGLRAQSFTAWIIDATPEPVRKKLDSWGVTDQRSVFSRSIGITAALNEPPTVESFSALFLNHYHRFLDYLYVCYQSLQPFAEISSNEFEVQLYASGEYSAMLSDQWTEN